MDTKKLREEPLPPLDDNWVKEMSETIAKEADLDVDEVARFFRRYWYKMFLELKRDGKAKFLDVGYLLLDEDNPEGGYKLVQFSEEQIEQRRLLNLQQQYGGELGNIGDPLEKDELHVELCTSFQLKELIEWLAEHKNVPAEQLEQKFHAQLKKAYREMVETGKEGRLPDFGVLRFTGESLGDIEFNFNEEVVELFEEHLEKE